MALLEGILTLAVPMGLRVVQFYALEDSGAYTLFDAGLPGSVQSKIASGEIPGPVTRAIISHADADHLGDAASLKGAEILCHALDREWIEDHDRLVSDRYGPFYAPDVLPALRQACGPDFAVARTVADEEVLHIGKHKWRVLHVPGHTHGHIALFRETDGVLLIGDAVLGLAIPAADGTPSMPPTHCYIAEYLATIRRFAELPVSLALSGHWPALDPAQFQQLLTDSRTCVERDLELLAGASEPLSAMDCVRLICGRYRSWPEAEDIHYQFPVSGYLEYRKPAGVHA